MNLMDEMLKKYNLSYDDLNPEETETLNTWLAALNQGEVNLERIKDYIDAMKDGVEQELTKYDLGSKQDLFLKARLRNYMLLSAFLSTPAKARAQLERAVAAMK
jgi:hypothetical protein